MYLSLPLNYASLKNELLDDFRGAVRQALSSTAEGAALNQAASIKFQGIIYKVSPLLDDPSQCLLEIYDVVGESSLNAHANVKRSDSFMLSSSKVACLESEICAYVQNRDNTLKFLAKTSEKVAEIHKAVERLVVESRMEHTQYKEMYDKFSTMLLDFGGKFSGVKSIVALSNALYRQRCMQIEEQMSQINEELARLSGGADDFDKFISNSLTPCSLSLKELKERIDTFHNTISSYLLSAQEKKDSLNFFLEAFDSLDTVLSLLVQEKSDCTRRAQQSLKLLAGRLENLSKSNLIGSILTN